MKLQSTKILIGKEKMLYFNAINMSESNRNNAITVDFITEFTTQIVVKPILRCGVYPFKICPVNR